MTLPVSGKITLNDVAVELGSSSGTRITLAQASVRTLFGVSSGRIALAADGHGKSNRAALSYTFSSDTANSTVDITALPGYIAGKTDLTITVNTFIYVYSTATPVPALTISSKASGDTITLVNNGYIIGQGGEGGIGDYYSPTNLSTGGSNGGPALSINSDITIVNNSYIAGGGGGGAGSASPYLPGGNGGGGGGAGGGAGGAGKYRDSGGRATVYNGGAGGTLGAVGSNGTYRGAANYVGGGGGGGRILPGDGGINFGTGGGAGGAGNRGVNTGNGTTSMGGSANNAGTNGDTSSLPHAAGGGGGWGAAGGNADLAASYKTGGTGGNGIKLNSYSVTYSVTGTIYGAVS